VSGAGLPGPWWARAAEIPAPRRPCGRDGHGLDTHGLDTHGLDTHGLDTHGPDGARPAAIAALCGEFAGVCASAVDPLEIASALEFEGLSDRTARTVFGCPDVFALAEAMYGQVERSPAEPRPASHPWESARAHPVLHGILYGLPAVCYPAAGALLAGPGALGTLLVALLVAWALSQGLASLGYQRLGAGDRAGARSVLLAGMAGGLALAGAATTAAALVGHAGVPVLLAGTGESAYLLGACVLLVLGAQRWLLPALVPGAAAASVFLLLGRPAGLAAPVWGLLAATPAAAVTFAVVRTRPAAGRSSRVPRMPRPVPVHRLPAGLRGLLRAMPGRPRSVPSLLRAMPGRLRSAAGLLGRVPGAWPASLVASQGIALARVRGTGRIRAALPAPAELRDALPAASFGVVAAGLLAFPVLAGPYGNGSARTGALAAAVPLSLSMGAAEWILLWYRRRTQRLLREVRDTGLFRRGATLALLGGLLRYLAVAAALTAASAGLTALLAGLSQAALAQAGSYVILAAALFLALLLQAFRLRVVPLCAGTVALAAETAFRSHGMVAQFAASAGLLAVTAATALLMLGQAVRHAW
jgi:hypothetical protein